MQKNYICYFDIFSVNVRDTEWEHFVFGVLSANITIAKCKTLLNISGLQMFKKISFKKSLSS